MSTYKPPSRKTRHQELREDKVVTLYTRFLNYFEENRGVVFGILGGLALLILIGFGYGFFKDQKESQAQQALARAVRLYEANDYRGAIDGTDDITGLLEVADDFGGTKAGNLARFYAADAYFQLGENEQALTFFQRFDHSEDALGAGAYAGEAAIYENMGKHAEAADRYQKAALIFENEFTSARYLESAGRNYEAAGDFSEAQRAYELIKERFPESTQAQNVEMFMARVQVLERNG